MYLKRLELQGFKSFAGHTVFQLGPGITGVVGPNGVGKSNVADAIRWVMGEQSARTVRARRLEDVIFSGSSNRSPVGMAEVSLVLDNSDGWLPIDFQEVVVSRRAYRDGQSEYLINRNRVRLRDVNDLFLHSQLGQGGYAFIGQGLVEEVLSLRPEERRGLVEEAADVRRYRVKLDEARARLIATRDNLERVDLLLSEISPNLARLERQAERASAHARLSRELAQALQAWYGHHWRDAQDTLTAALAAYDQRQEEFRQAEAQIQACSEGGEALRKAIEERRRDIAQRGSAERDLAEAVRRLEHQCALDEERQRLLAERGLELRSDIESLDAERHRQSEIEVASDERESGLDEELEKRRAEAIARRQELAEAEKERAELRTGVVEAEEQAIRARNVVKEIEARLDRVRKTEEGLAQEIDELKSRRKDSLRRLAALAQDYRVHHEEKSRIESELAAVADGQGALNQRITDARAALARAEESVPEVQAVLQRAKARLDILGRVQDLHEGFDEATRTLLVAAGQVAPPEGEEDDYPDQGSLMGVVGVLARLIHVTPGVEKAIEAAFADSLQSIILETHSDALAAIQLLMEYKHGRVTLYSMDSLTPSRSVVLMKEKGIIGVASDLVSCETRFRPLIETLLGRTIVVENLIIGHRVIKRGMGNVVTLDGELLRPTGSITSGSSRSMGALVSRESELRHLPAQISQLESALKESQSEIAAQRQTLKDCDAALTDHAQRQQRLWQERAGLEQSAIEHSAHLALLSGQMRELRHQEGRSAQTVRQLLDERRGLERERDSLLGEAQAAVEAAGRHAETVAAVAARLPELTEALTQATAALAAVEGERQALDIRGEEREKALARVEAQLAHKQEQLAELDRQSSAAAARFDEAQASLADVRARWSDLTRVQGPGEEELVQLESREKSLRSEMDVALSRRREAEIGLIEAQTEVARKTDELNALREGMEAEGLVPTETGDVVPVSAAGQELPHWLTSGGVLGEPEDRLPPIAGGSAIDPVALKEQISQLRARIRSLGPVDAQAPADYAESRQRYDFLSGQMEDLRLADTSLQEAIGELEERIEERFAAAFQQVDEQFQKYFATFFGGGTARLVATQAKDGAESGIEIMAQPPGKRVANLSMLSGGERALTAVSLLFALLQTRPSPFCVLDEVDAMLDESNVGRFTEAVKQLAEASQFIVVTHNRRTIEMADHIYGVSMGKDMTSSILSLRLSDLATAP
ncbi:MAG: chromosome segregation protein SMC [Dehalococcoidia bacterium]|jgi:chromosome segregation protein